MEEEDNFLLKEGIVINYTLSEGDVVLVQNWGYGFAKQDIGKYVEVVSFHPDQYLGQGAVTFKAYDSVLETTLGDGAHAGVESFGEVPLILLNTKEGLTKEDELIGKEFQVYGQGDIYKLHNYSSEEYIVTLSVEDVSSSSSGIHEKNVVRQRVDKGVWVLVENQSEQPVEEYTGSSSNYYKVYVKHPTTLPEPYEAECNDVIESLQMTFAEGNAFKAIWRKAKSRQGVKKKGYDNGVYDSEKVVFFGERMLIEAKDNE